MVAAVESDLFQNEIWRPQFKLYLQEKLEQLAVLGVTTLLYEE